MQMRSGSSAFRTAVRQLRDHPLIRPVVNFPFTQLRRIGLRLPQTFYQHIPHHGVFSVDVPGGHTFRMAAHGHQLENSVYWDGLYGYERASVERWIAFARNAEVVLDIGANTGLYALVAAAAAQNARVFAFEPLLRVTALLSQNCALNPDFAIEVVSKAAGAESGTAQIYDPGGDNCYSASLKAGFLPEARTTTYPVEVVAIDDFVAERKLARVDLVKVDVEGFDASVLAGMKNTIERFAPIILIEQLGDDQEVPAGYRVERVDARNVLLHPA